MAAGTEKGLTAAQRRAAALLASGHQVRETAVAVNVTGKTVSRWGEREEFRTLVRGLRQQLLPESATAEAVLVAALSATKANGQPDWNARIAAARALLSAPVTEEAREAAKRVERIHIQPPEGDADPSGTPPTDPFARQRGDAPEDLARKGVCE